MKRNAFVCAFLPTTYTVRGKVKLSNVFVCPWGGGGPVSPWAT